MMQVMRQRVKSKHVTAYTKQLMDQCDDKEIPEKGVGVPVVSRAFAERFFLGVVSSLRSSVLLYTQILANAVQTGQFNFVRLDPDPRYRCEVFHSHLLIADDKGTFKVIDCPQYDITHLPFPHIGYLGWREASVPSEDI